MDKEQALHDFWSSFGLEAYDSNTVPTGGNAPAFPYITYDVGTDSLDSPIVLSGNLWYYGQSWQEITSKCHEIEKQIAEFGFYVKRIDEGYMWITKGHPFAQRMADDTSDMIRRIYIQIQVEFMTAY